MINLNTKADRKKAQNLVNICNHAVFFKVN